MIDVFSLAEQDTRLHKEAILEYSGPCPDHNCRCQRNGFRVRWKGTKWRFMCRGCFDSRDNDGWGDEIDYLSHYRHMSYRQARAYLEGQEVSSVLPAPLMRVKIPPSVERMKACQAELWGEDTRALDYARSRGFTSKTIRAAGMGYSTYQGIPRLLIPSLVDGKLVEVMRRDLRPDVSRGKRWVDAGGSERVLYMTDGLKRLAPTVLCEDAFSALSVWQECPDINAVATCSATGCKSVQWLMRLASQPLVLVALDADETGDKEAQWWVDRLPRVRRLRPLLKDINDMLMGGWDIRGWIEDAINPPKPEPEPEPEFDLLEHAKSLVEPHFGPCEVKVFHNGGYTLDTRVAALQEQKLSREQAYDRAMWAMERKKKASVHSIEWSRAQVSKYDPDAYRYEKDKLQLENTDA